MSPLQEGGKHLVCARRTPSTIPAHLDEHSPDLLALEQDLPSDENGGIVRALAIAQRYARLFNYPAEPS